MTSRPMLRVVLPMAEIHTYCQKWKIRELAVFGSVLREDFNEDSDLDLLVTFADDLRYTLSDMVRMGDELEAIVGRPIDLLTRKSIEESPNYIRRREILNTLEVIYAQA